MYLTSHFDRSSSHAQTHTQRMQTLISKISVLFSSTTLPKEREVKRMIEINHFKNNYVVQLCLTEIHCLTKREVIT